MENEYDRHVHRTIEYKMGKPRRGWESAFANNLWKPWLRLLKHKIPLRRRRFNTSECRQVWIYSLSFPAMIQISGTQIRSNAIKRKDCDRKMHDLEYRTYHSECPLYCVSNVFVSSVRISPRGNTRKVRDGNEIVLKRGLKWIAINAINLSTQLNPVVA